MILGADPLLSGGVGLAVVLIVLFKVVLAFVFLLVATMLMIWFERKLIGDMQNRVGPNRAGPWGIMQSMADGIKVFFKEDLTPERSDRFVFKLAPYLSLIPAFITFTVVPLGGHFEKNRGGVVRLFGRTTLFQVADPPIGILLVLAMSSIAVYGVMLAGWASGSKYPLIGSVRASAQMVSYEAALGLSVVAVVLVSGSLTTNGIVDSQFGAPWRWNLFTTGIVPFVVFLIAGTAELNRPPFDLVEAEQEIVGGYQTEYSGVRFALFYLAEFMNTITMSAIIVTLFLGGPTGPAVVGPEWLWGLFWFFLKLVVFLFVFVWFRATLPRFRYDQLMDLGWKGLIPFSLGWLLLLTAIRVGDDQNWNPWLTLAVSIVVLAGAAGLMSLAFRRARLDHGVDRRREVRA
ncbi:MAG: NADH-quinone oxidoreductase subunit NuoH [Actinobacteria bacterium]|nr:NADH-quinone oxidoreductase subunit NuoH [Actinomycetota bacterium]